MQPVGAHVTLMAPWFDPYQHLSDICMPPRAFALSTLGFPLLQLQAKPPGTRRGPSYLSSLPSLACGASPALPTTPPPITCVR